MASPQCENGYVKIANELMDAFCKYFPGGSMGQVLIAVLRKTYGWNKKCDQLSISEIVKTTGLCRRAVIYAVKNLEAKGMISVTRNKIDDLNETNLIQFQKDHERWVVQRIDETYQNVLENQKARYQSLVVQRMDGSAKNGKKVVQRMVKDEQFFAPTKDNIKTKKKHSLSEGGFDRFYSEYPRKVKKADALKAWNKIKPSPELEEAIISSVIKNKSHNPQWLKNDGQYIPYPSTWLNGKQWEDVLEAEATREDYYDQVSRQLREQHGIH